MVMKVIYLVLNSCFHGNDKSTPLRHRLRRVICPYGTNKKTAL